MNKQQHLDYVIKRVASFVLFICEIRDYGLTALAGRPTSGSLKERINGKPVRSRWKRYLS
ncbi:hypothetical protein SCARR_03639 [Pontiella sulfatireligans]|uniref:Uncharacterized protein n=1 Tax=Pontiella sulfatireligans TaxID=2750658 RepID=A0A6C2UMR9_9BACT|nr:hypothetical protein SCARR_03639 [Pontiella sulfatireligans]